MLVGNYTLDTGWSALEIKPYGPLSLTARSDAFVFQVYCPNAFECMKVCPLVHVNLCEVVVREFNIQAHGMGWKDQIILT